MSGLLGVIALVVSVADVTQSPAPRVNPCDSTFDAFAQSQNIEQAIAGYRACLPSAPKTAHYNLGVLYAGTQEWPHAIEHFEEYLKLDRTSARARQVSAELSLLRQLQQEYSTPEKVQGFRHDSLLRQSRLFLKSGLNQEAELLVLRALLFSGGAYDDYVQLAAVAAARQDFDLALRRLDQAEMAAPANKGRLSDLRASVTKEQKIATFRKSAEASLRTNPRRAAELFSAASSLAPDRTEIAFAAAVAYLATSDPQLAIPILDKLSTDKDADLAQRARKLDADVRRLMALVSQKRARESATLADLLKSTGKKNWTDLGAPELARVEPALADRVKGDPGSLALRHHYAFVLARQQKWSEAETQYQEILRLQPNAPVKFWLARVLYNEKKYAESQSALNEDLRSGDNGTPATAQLKTFLAEDVADAIKKGSN